MPRYKVTYSIFIDDIIADDKEEAQRIGDAIFEDEYDELSYHSFKKEVAVWALE